MQIDSEMWPDAVHIGQLVYRRAFSADIDHLMIIIIKEIYKIQFIISPLHCGMNLAFERINNQLKQITNSVLEATNRTTV